jgi:hypothetical protein
MVSVAFLACGTRGDVQPVLLLARGYIRTHPDTRATFITHAELVEELRRTVPDVADKVRRMLRSDTHASIERNREQTHAALPPITQPCLLLGCLRGPHFRLLSAARDIVSALLPSLCVGLGS